jgi:hypothetical protein
MAEDTIDKVAMVGKLPIVNSTTAFLHIHGHKTQRKPNDFLDVYGTDADLILDLVERKPELKEKNTS